MTDPGPKGAWPRTPPLPRTLPDRFVADLGALVGERLSLNAVVRLQHGRDQSWHPAAAPDAVVFARSTAEVSDIVRLCARDAIPVVPFGAGTSLEGHVTAPSGGVCVDLSGLDRILAVRPEDMDCTVEAGVTQTRLNAELRDQGLFFPIDPGATATIGGMAATRASGTNAVRYGTMRDVVLGLTVVLADGSVIRTGGRARKSSAGYDLTRLFVGSEGTLGIITEITLRLAGIPETIAAAVCAFPTLGGAVATVIATIQAGVPVARVEFLDARAIEAVNAHSRLDMALLPTLFFEFHGSPASVAEQVEIVEALASERGGGRFEWASRPEERRRLWQARHEAYWACATLRPGAQGWPTDVCVPISRLAACVEETSRDLAALPFPAAIMGHVGDGNFHCVLMIDPDDPAEVAAARAFSDRLVRRALEADGTCTGEHGIGAGKIGYLQWEHGSAIPAMRAVKSALDPRGLFNPGKILPDDV